MPTVMWIGALRVVIYPNDHRPAHVHVIGHGHEAVFELDNPQGPVKLRENYGFGTRDCAKIKRALESNLEHLLAAWKRIHGYA